MTKREGEQHTRIEFFASPFALFAPLRQVFLLLVPESKGGRKDAKSAKEAQRIRREEWLKRMPRFVPSFLRACIRDSYFVIDS